MPTYQEALDLFHEWTSSESLRRHAYAVEASMAHYARLFGEDEETWRITGLLHDMDYEKHRQSRGIRSGGATGWRGKGMGVMLTPGFSGKRRNSGAHPEPWLRRRRSGVARRGGCFTAV